MNNYISNLLVGVKKYEIDFSILDGLSEGACISGSIVLQSIISEDWFGDRTKGGKGSDLDLYVHKEDVEIIKSKLTSIGYKIKTNASYYGNMKVIKFFKWSDLYEEDISFLYFFKRTRSIELNIDLVIIDGSIDDYINNFDLDICKNSYDGNKLKIHNIEGINNRVATYVMNDQWKFTLCDRDEEILTVKDAKILSNQTLVRRIDKYKQRGFVVNGFEKYLSSLDLENDNPSFLKIHFQFKQLENYNKKHGISMYDI